MTTDLDERIARALGARADALTVTRPPLDDVLTGRGPVRARPSGPRRPALLVAAAALAVLGVAAAVVATRSDDGGMVDVRPAEEGSTTTTTPELDLSYVPEGLPAAPVEATSPDGRTTVLTYGAGDRALEVTVREATRTEALEAALDARDTTAIVVAYAGGGSQPTGAGPPPSPLADEILGDPTALPDRAGSVLADARAGDDPYLLVLDVFPARGQRVDVGLVAFRDGAEVRVAGRGLALAEATAVLAGLDGPGLAPRPRPDDAADASRWGPDTSFLRPAVRDLPEGWGLSTLPGQGTTSQSGYGPADAAPVDPGAPFPPGPALDITLSRSEPLPQQQEVLDQGGDAALVEVFGLDDLGIWVAGAEKRVLEVEGVRLVATTGTVDDTTVADAGVHELTWVIGQLGPDVRLEVLAEGLTDDQLVAAIGSLVAIR